MRDTENPGMRASRNPSRTQRPGRPETEGSPLDQAWQGVCGAGAVTGGPPWRAEPAPQLAGPSVRKLKVSYIRARAGRGAPGPVAPSRCAPPARRLRPPPLQPRQKHAGPGRAGLGGGLGLRRSAENRPRGPNPGPLPQTARTSQDLDVSSSGPEIPDPSPDACAPPCTLNFQTPRPL